VRPGRTAGDDDADHPARGAAALEAPDRQDRPQGRFDALILLAEHPLADDDGSGDSATGTAAINRKRINEILANDWGWWRTVTGNLDKLAHFLEVEIREGELETGRPHRFDAATQLAALRAAIEAAPKSTRWKLRSRVGDRMPWYVEPEEMTHTLA
jgi:hypothetical protein